MDLIIRKALKGRKKLILSYEGTRRTVEPHTFGISRTGNLALCAWQLTGGSGQGFRLLNCYGISDLIMLDEVFPSARRGYRRGYPQFALISAEL
jgi:predicted DNA-binding transcriptional regulator YafY